MDHQQAIQLGAVEKYCLNELPLPQRGEFEEHYFGCLECAADVRLTAAFLDTARQELTRGDFAGATSKALKRSWLELFARPAVLTPALGLLLAVVVYQNGVELPRINGQIAQLRQPGIVATVSLIGGNSRGDALPPTSGRADQPILLSFDIPAVKPYAAYACVLTDASGAVVWRVPVSPAQAQDTVSINIPAGALRAGNYTLVVQGLESPNGGASTARGADLARYKFVLNPSP